MLRAGRADISEYDLTEPKLPERSPHGCRYRATQSNFVSEMITLQMFIAKAGLTVEKLESSKVERFQPGDIGPPGLRLLAAARPQHVAGEEASGEREARQHVAAGGL